MFYVLLPKQGKTYDIKVSLLSRNTHKSEISLALMRCFPPFIKNVSPQNLI